MFVAIGIHFAFFALLCDLCVLIFGAAKGAKKRRERKEFLFIYLDI